MLIRDVDNKDIMHAVYELGALKALGSDGFNGVFYKRYQEIVKDCIVSSVQSFFHSGHMLRKLNCTSIVLVQKVKNPDDVAQFRPISYCNFGFQGDGKQVARVYGGFYYLGTKGFLEGEANSR